MLLMCVLGRSERLTLEECLAAGMESNLGLRGAQKKIEASEARKGTGFDIPNTAVELSQSSIEGAGIDNGLTFSQEFDFPTVYVARRKVLTAEADLSKAEYNLAARQLREEITSIYYSLLYQEEKLRYLAKEEAAYTEFSRISRERFEAGETSRLELLSAERLKVKLQARMEDVKLEIGQLQSRLAQTIGRGDPVDTGGEGLSVIDIGEDALDFDAQSSQSSRVWQARIAINERSLALARQEFLPGFSVSATSQLLIKGFNPYHVERERFRKGDFMGFSVGVTVPLFFGSKRSQLMTAKHEVELARLQLEDEMQRQEMEFGNLKKELTFARQRLDYYEREALSQAEELGRIARISYELGEIDYLEYMQNVESAVEIWMEYLDTIERYNQSVIKIQSLRYETL